MQRTSYYIIAVVLAGVAITSFWVYQRYFKVAQQSFLYFHVDRGDMQEVVKVRGEVVAQKEFQLGFTFSGVVTAVYVHDGDKVSYNQPLMKLDTKNLALQRVQQEAVVEQKQASLAKLRAGASLEDISVSESRLASAQVGVDEAKKGLVDSIKDAYTISDDAVRAKTYQLFDNSQSSNPTLNISAEGSVKNDLGMQRVALEGMLNAWSVELSTLSIKSDLAVAGGNARKNMASVFTFLNTLSPVLSNLTATSNMSQTSIDKYVNDLSSARTSVGAGITSVVAAEEKLTLAQANVALYTDELALKRAPARIEDIAVAQAGISEARSQLDVIDENMKKSVLYAPAAGSISKVHYEVGEVFTLGQSAVSISTYGYKLQADVSELDIAKIRGSNGNDVRVELDSFPGRQFFGKVLSVDSQEVVKTEDKYYRVNIAFDAGDATIRSGMSADIVILSVVKKGVLRVPALAVYADGKTKYLKILLNGLTQASTEASAKKVDIQTGITDGEFVELLSGPEEGQIAIVSAE